MASDKKPTQKEPFVQPDMKGVLGPDAGPAKRADIGLLKRINVCAEEAVKGQIGKLQTGHTQHGDTVHSANNFSVFGHNGSMEGVGFAPDKDGSVKVGVLAMEGSFIDMALGNGGKTQELITVDPSGKLKEGTPETTGQKTDASIKSVQQMTGKFKSCMSGLPKP